MRFRVLLVACLCVSQVLAAKAGRKGQAKSAKVAKNPQGGPANNGFPASMSVELNIEGFDSVQLQLNRDTKASLPASTVAGRNGKKESHQKAQDSTAFYTDSDGKGVFSCVKKGKGQNDDCNLQGVVHLGDQQCAISEDKSEADCTKRQDGFRIEMQTPTRSSSHYGRKRRSVANSPLKTRQKRLTKPGNDYRVLEVVYVLDKAFVQPFYDVNPSDDQAALDDITDYMARLTVELNVYAQSMVRASEGLLELYIYCSEIIIPPFGEDLPFIDQYTVDNVWVVTDDSDLAVRQYLVSDLPELTVSSTYEHTVFLTGLDMATDTVDGTGLLGYAYLSTVCTQIEEDKPFKYSFSEDLDYNVAETLIHEIGHALGSPHDMGRCPAGFFIMSPYAFEVSPTTLGTYHRFSSCSARSILSYLQSTPSNCMKSDTWGFTEEEFMAKFCQGYLGEEDFSLDTQCKRLTGWVGSVACNAVTSTLECYQKDSIRCQTEQDPDTSSCSATLGYVWTGTPCGGGNYCYHGVCTSGEDLCGPNPNCSCCGMKGRRKDNCCNADPRCYCCY